MASDSSINLTIERLWQFSLQYYSVKEVKEACLSLQNKYHGNVNLLLMLKWLDEHNLTFKEEWTQVQRCILRSEVLLQHYRELRKKLKNNLPDSLYRESLEFELLLEKQQQSDLVDCINALSLSENTGAPLTKRYCEQLNAAHLSSTFSKKFY